MGENHPRKVGAVLLAALICIFVFPLMIHSINSQESQEGIKIPDESAFEEELLEQVNKERSKRGLSLLHDSWDLKFLARKHSQDMANIEKLGHLSSTGKSYIDRLVEAGFFFQNAGENVAYSQTFLAELIHQSLMDSPRHRDNILDPDFTQAGIGVAYAENAGYYITQDFMHPHEFKSKSETREALKKWINEERKRKSIPSLVFLDDVDSLADRISNTRAKGNVPPLMPKFSTETHIFQILSPSLVGAFIKLEKAAEAIFDRGAVGIWFDRNEDSPGGAYFITVLLFLKDRFLEMTEESLREVVLSEINKIRQKEGLHQFKLNIVLSVDAQQISCQCLSQNRINPMIPSRLATRYKVSIYSTQDPSLLPKSLLSKVKRILSRQVGVGICTSLDEEINQRTYWVTVIF